MQTRRDICVSLIAMAMLSSRSIASIAAEPGPITPKAAMLASLYDREGVEHLWPAGMHVNWETGQPDGGPVSAKGKHTHCSAFVGAVAKRLGIYILRPPEHGQTLLANAQLDWLETAGAGEGWQSIGDAIAAQAAANKGMFVVACYRNHNSAKPGHIAIIRPAVKTVAQIETEGPDEIQAGLVNYTRTTLAAGFAGHPLAWGTAKEVRFYAHDWDGKLHVAGPTTF